MLIRKIRCLVSFVLLLACITSAQEVTITGFVRDGVTGEPLLGANLLIYQDSVSSHQSPFQGTATNHFGYYAMPNIPDGYYILIIRYIGYKTKVKEITVVADSGDVREIVELERDEITLEEILVEGEKEFSDEISTIDISPDLIKKLPSLSGEVDLLRILQTLPGVNNAGELSSGLYVRGGSPDQTLTLVDEVILYNPSHIGNFASTFNTSAIRDIKLIKGAFPAEYGGRLSSVLDVKLRTGTKERFKGKFGLGTINSHYMIEGPLGSDATFMIAGRNLYYDVYQKNFDVSSSVPRYNFFDMNAKILYNFTDASLITLSAYHNKDNLYNPPSSTDAMYDIQWQNNIFSLNWLQINTKSIFSNTTISYTNYDIESIISDNDETISVADYFSKSTLRDFFIKQHVEIHYLDNLMIKSGLELFIHNYDLIYNNGYDELLLSDPFSTENLKSVEGAAYLQSEWDITPQLRVNMGGRFYYFKSNQYSRIEPRFSLRYAFNENLFFNAAFSEAHQFLHLIVRDDIALPTDLWYPSTSRIHPEHSRQYVVGFDSYFLDHSLQFSVEGYYRDMKNLYDFKGAPTINLQHELIEDQFTKGEGEAYGLEFFLNKRSGALSGWIGYTLSYSKRRFEELNYGRMFYPRYDRRHDVSVVLTYDLLDNLTLGAIWLYASGQGITIPTGKYNFTPIGPHNRTAVQFNYTLKNAHKLPDYHKLDLNATYSFSYAKLPIDLSLNIYNVYNRKNPFAQYVTIKDTGEKTDSGDTAKEVQVKEIILFPFIPTLAITVHF